MGGGRGGGLSRYVFFLVLDVVGVCWLTNGLGAIGVADGEEGSRVVTCFLGLDAGRVLKPKLQPGGLVMASQRGSRVKSSHVG